tara:strand:+ start:179 stop:475 length:297 start_codon:yes stop_codon:yes gene_type:complete
MQYQKFKSFLYKPSKPFHKMSMRELCDYNKVIKELDKMPLEKIKRIEKWPQEKREKKIKKFLNKHKEVKTLKRLKKRTKRKTKKLKLNKHYFSLCLIE